MRFTLAFVAIAAGLTVGITHASPTPPALGVTITVSASPAQAGLPVTFTANANGGIGGLTYQWDFGDTVTTGFLPQNQILAHTYAKAVHVVVTLNVEDILHNTASATVSLTVRNLLPALKPTNSSTIILDATNSRVWCVNADQDTVSALDATTNALLFEIPVGKNPRTLAQAADKTLWVVSQQHPSISVLDPLTGALLHVIPLPHGSLPYGICMTPDGKSAYVSFQGLGGVTKIKTLDRTVEATSSVPPEARGISVSGDGRVFVTRFLSPQPDPLLAWNSAAFIEGNHGEVVEFTPALAVVRTVKLVLDPGDTSPLVTDPDFGANVAPSTNISRGVPNYISSMVISPDGTRAWVPSKKDNVQRGTKTPERDGRVPSSEITYRAIISSIDLTSKTKTVDELLERRDIDNSEMPQAACISPNGDLIFIALQGNNRVQVRDLYDMDVLLNGIGQQTGSAINALDGLAPQGLVLEPVLKKLFVHNYMGRTVSVFDAAAVLDSNGQPAILGLPVIVPTILAADKLGTTVLAGKQVFYNADDPRMSRQGYISCAGCHLDGISDMRVWDFTNRGEGFRNTVVLQGRGGTMMGNVHWSANFNEIQDFDNDIFFRFHDGALDVPPSPPPSLTSPPGLPLLAGSPYSPMNVLNNTGRSADLDALAAYVASLNKVSRSPFRNTDGTLTAQAAAGEAVFKQNNCQKCHKGRNFTDSVVGTALAPIPAREFAPLPGEFVLHDVGTIKGTSGQRLGVVTLPGVDTPTLKGLWQAAPYFHDGSAATLMDVFNDASAPLHFLGATLSDQEKANLVRYMLEIDEVDAPPVPPAQVNTLSIGAAASGRPWSLGTAQIGALPFVDRSYTITALPPALSGKVLLRSAEDDKASGTGSMITLTLTAATDVYVYYDARAGANRPAWLDASWVASPANDITISPGLTMNAFLQTFAAGTVTLGGNLNGGATGALRNYFAVLTQAGVVYEEGPLSQLEWAHDRDADGDGLRDEYEALAHLSPWSVTTGIGTIPDEDKTLPGGGTVFSAQAASESGATVNGGGGGGCGLIGLEPLILLAAFSALGRRRRKQ